MTTVQILVKVIEHFDVELPDPPGPGHRFLSATISRSNATTTARREAACRRKKSSALQARIQDL
jgi:hypothetical protein